MTEDVDPEAPRPEGHYHITENQGESLALQRGEEVNRDAEWHTRRR